MIINRKTPPLTSPVGQLNLPELSPQFTATGIPLYTINDPLCRALKLEFVFDAGSRNQDVTFQAQATSMMLTEGTSTRSAQAIAEELDYYGAYLQPRFGIDDTSLVLYCLPKHLEQCLIYVNDILNNALFPDNELDTYKQNAIQRLKINESKGTYLARRAFYTHVFGASNCYGSAVNQQVIENISRETLQGFYQKHYRSSVKYAILSGNVDAETFAKTSSLLSAFNHTKDLNKTIALEKNATGVFKVNKTDAVQTTIRIGMPIIGRKHPNYRRLQFLNLILGGYFGSRLMSNIREEKGLTYGIYSAVESHQDAASFFIETEMNDNLSASGIAEIMKEISRIKSDPIPEKELQVAANYMIGSFLRSFDGPFSMADRYKTLIDYGFNNYYYDDFIEIIRTTTALDLQELANKYFKEEALITILVGKA